MEELKKTEYAEKVIAVTLASKEHYCINPEVRRKCTTLSDLNTACAELRRKDKCRYGSDLQRLSTAFENLIVEHKETTGSGVGKCPIA